MAQRYKIPDPQSEETLAALGERIATWRKLHQLTQEQLARRAGIARPVLTRLERGEDGVGIGALARVLIVLQVEDRVIEALDPYRTQWGREMAHRSEVKRVRRPAPRKKMGAADA